MQPRYAMRAVGCLLLVASLALTGCASTKGAGQQPAVYGVWDFSMFNPGQGTLTGVMTLGQAEDGSVTGHVTIREMGVDEAIEVHSLDLDGPAFTLNGRATGTDFTITGVVAGDEMTGENNVAGVGVFAMTATRMKP